MKLQKILDTLTASDIQFVIIGGVALNIHGSPRVTFDSDLAIKTIDIDRVIEVLIAAGLEMVIGVNENSHPLLTTDTGNAIDFAEKSRWGFLKFVSESFELDVIYEIPVPFAVLFRDSRKIMAGRTEVRVASIEHIRVMKEKAKGSHDDEKRDIDLMDLKFIEKKIREGNDDT